MMPAYGGEESATAIPMSSIQQLRGLGLSNQQIIASLQKEGYSNTQIYDALNQLEVMPMGPQVAAMQAPQPQPQPLNTPSVGAGFGKRMEYTQPYQRKEFEPLTDTEEMIEAIIDEKWNDLLGDINKVVAWKESTEARMVKLEQQLVDLREAFDKLQQAVVGKVGEYDQHILEVGAEVKAMEKVFSKVLPVFTDNVAELSRVADVMRKGK